MNILLDTHTLIWLIEDDPHLGEITSTTLRNPTHRLFVSHFNLYELTIKHHLGKLRMHPEAFEGLLSVNIEIIPPDTAIYDEYEMFNAQNKDPFDNILIATAIHEGLTLATADRNILTVSHPRLKLLDVRT